MTRHIFWPMLALVFCCTLVANAQTQAPALKLKNTRGATVNLSNYKGKVTLVNFWATWCPPCRAEMPDLIRWQREYRGKGLQIIGITYPPTRLREVRQFTRSIGVNYPILIGTKKTKALFDLSEAMPLTIIIDREGRIRDRIEGIILREEFERKVKPLLD
jgi:thiol-disulfide isomerase/thioredoxin